MQVIPAIDVDGGRSRVVYWPGAGAGVGAPTDRPERIAEAFSAMGARLIHLVDFAGARSGAPTELAAIGAIAARTAVPLQVAGGVESADAIRLVFAAGATRVVVSLGIVDRPDELRACLDVAGDWLAVGLDPRPDRLTAFPWRRGAPPSLEELVEELVGAGVGRFVVSHGGAGPDHGRLRALIDASRAEVLVAGGVRSLDDLRALRDTGVAGVLLGETLLSGAIPFAEAVTAAA